MALRTEVNRNFTNYVSGQSLVFFGNELLATGVESTAPLFKSLLDYGHSIEALVLSGQPQKKPYVVESLAKDHGIAIHWIQNKTDLSRTVKKLNSEIAVLASFGMIIPQSVLDAFVFGIINIHPSLLPKYRGSSPIEQAILNGDNETGFSIMQLTAAMDAGPLFLQAPVPMEPDMSKQALYQAIAALAGKELPELLTDIISGVAKADAQLGAPSYTSKITKADGIIDWQTPATTIKRQVRAYAGWPKSKTTVAGVEVVLHQLSLCQTSDLQPGKHTVVDKKLLVGSESNDLEIQRLQPQSKKIMDAVGFINGYLN